MEYLANVLPIEPKRWTLNRATMTDKVINIEAGGSVFVSLTHTDVQYTPKAFKVRAKFKGVFNEFKPSVYAKLLIKDTTGIYQVFSAPFQVRSKASDSYIMETELITDCADFSDLLFHFFAEEPVEIIEWKLYPSADIDTSSLNVIESMMPQFLFYFNEKAINAGTIETEIVNLPFAMGKAGNLSNHLLFNYVASSSATLTIQIKVDGAPEPYAPLVTQINAGAGFVGIPHSFIQVKASSHLISVGVSLSEGTLSIPAKGVRYTCEGRGILGGASGDYPHAEVSDTYEYPKLVLGKLECHASGDASLIYDKPQTAAIDRYIYPTLTKDKVPVYVGIPKEAIIKFGACSIYEANTKKPDDVTLYGSLVLTTNGISFVSGVGEGIAVFKGRFPVTDLPSVVNAFSYITTNNPILRFAFGSDSNHWYTTVNTSGDISWVPIELTNEDMALSAIVAVYTSAMSDVIWQKLFDITGSSKLMVAAYMISSSAQTSFTLNRLELYNSVDDTELPLEPPVVSYIAGENKFVRVHWTPPQGPPRAYKVLWGLSADTLTSSVKTPIGASSLQINNLVNGQVYYVAVCTIDLTRESPLSNVVFVSPSVAPAPRWLDFVVSPSTLSMKWQKIGIMHDYYNIYCGESVDSMSLLANSTEPEYVAEDMLNNKEYFVAIAGLKDSEETSYSDIKSGKPMLPSVTILSYKTSKSSIVLNLAISGTYTGYSKFKVYYGLSPSEATNVVESASLKVVINDLEPGTSYYATATGVHNTEESVPEELVKIETTLVDTLTLTVLGNIGRDKPTQEQADIHYVLPVEIINGYQKWVVPKTGQYNITAIGAAGGNGSPGSINTKCLGGFGAEMSGNFSLTEGNELYCIVGQKGVDALGPSSGDGITGAGGGMSTVVVADETSQDILSLTSPIKVRPLIVAGAGNGGGDGVRASGVPGANALLTEGSLNINNAYSGAGFRTHRNSSDSGNSFLLGCDAAVDTYTRSSFSSIPGFGGGASNTDDGAGGGGAGYYGSYMGATFGGSSFNAGTDKKAVLRDLRTNGQIIIIEVAPDA